MVEATKAVKPGGCQFLSARHASRPEGIDIIIEITEITNAIIESVFKTTALLLPYGGLCFPDSSLTLALYRLNSVLTQIVELDESRYNLSTPSPRSPRWSSLPPGKRPRGSSNESSQPNGAGTGGSRRPRHTKRRQGGEKDHLRRTWNPLASEIRSRSPDAVA